MKSITALLVLSLSGCATWVADYCKNDVACIEQTNADLARSYQAMGQAGRQISNSAAAQQPQHGSVTCQSNKYGNTSCSY